MQANSPIKTETDGPWFDVAGGKPCPFCGREMNMVDCKQTSDDGRKVTYCGRWRCLRAELIRRGHDVPRRPGNDPHRHERRMRNANYHLRGLEVRPGKVKATWNLEGQYFTSTTK